MFLKSKYKKLLTVLSLVIAVIGGFVFFAFARTWNKTDIEFDIHINEKLIKESTFGESPTFAVWLEDPESKLTQTVFVTNRAGKGDWEGKAAVPVALPKWFKVNEMEKLTEKKLGNEIPREITISGATPKPGYFSTRVRVNPGSKWICWIEVNLAGDFNETYKEYDIVNKTSDDYKTGQPALLYRANIEAILNNKVKPEIMGMCFIDSNQNVLVQPLAGITTATDIFDQMIIKVVNPKPKIMEW